MIFFWRSLTRSSRPYTVRRMTGIYCQRSRRRLCLSRRGSAEKRETNGEVLRWKEKNKTPHVSDKVYATIGSAKNKEEKGAQPLDSWRPAPLFFSPSFFSLIRQSSAATLDNPFWILFIFYYYIYEHNGEKGGGLYTLVAVFSNNGFLYVAVDMVEINCLNCRINWQDFTSTGNVANLFYLIIFKLDFMFSPIEKQDSILTNAVNVLSRQDIFKYPILCGRIDHSPTDI